MSTQKKSNQPPLNLSKFDLQKINVWRLYVSIYEGKTRFGFVPNNLCINSQIDCIFYLKRFVKKLADNPQKINISNVANEWLKSGNILTDYLPFELPGLSFNEADGYMYISLSGLDRKEANSVVNAFRAFFKDLKNHGIIKTFDFPK